MGSCSSVITAESQAVRAPAAQLPPKATPYTWNGVDISSHVRALDSNIRHTIRIAGQKPSQTAGRFHEVPSNYGLTAELIEDIIKIISPRFPEYTFACRTNGGSATGDELAGLVCMLCYGCDAKARKFTVTANTF